MASSPYINHFIQPDTIIPNPANPQNWNRYSYVQNNPIRFSDPTGHFVVQPHDGECDIVCAYSGSEWLELVEFVEDEIVNKNGRIRKKHEDNILNAMLLVVEKAANLYGDDWNGFFDATDFVFTGYFGHGSDVMLMANFSDFPGYFDGSTGFHPDFVDKSNQVRHFWVALANAADPYGENPNGEAIANFGNWFHDIFEDTGRENDGASVMDFKLTVTGIDIAQQIGNEIKTPADLAKVLLYRLGTNGPGYIGPEVDTTRWKTPWD